jgi:Na+-transporting methylmalonyl-CoA/oxaloacetate decarboxylase gamma subunit
MKRKFSIGVILAVLSFLIWIVALSYSLLTPSITFFVPIEISSNPIVFGLFGLVVISSLVVAMLFFSELKPRNKPIVFACNFKEIKKMESKYRLVEITQGSAHVYKNRQEPSLKGKLFILGIYLSPAYFIFLISAFLPVFLNKMAFFTCLFFVVYFFLFWKGYLSKQLFSRIILPKNQEAIFINKKCCSCMYGRFILLHEEGHLALNTEKESEATAYALSHISEEEILEGIAHCELIKAHFGSFLPKYATHESWKKLISNLKSFNYSSSR